MIANAAESTFFKLPAADALGDLTNIQKSFDFLSPGNLVFPKNSDNLDLMSTMTNHLSAKVQTIPQVLPFIASAAESQKAAETIDAIAGVPAAPFPDAIGKAFPDNKCQSISVSEAFKTVTETKEKIEGKISAMTAGLDNQLAGTLSPLILAIQAAGGPAIASGKELLTYIGNAPTVIKSAISSAISSSLAISSVIGSAVSQAQAAVSDLTADFNAAVSKEIETIKAAEDHVRGTAVVDLFRLADSNPCVSSIIENSVDKTKIDNVSLEISKIDFKKEIVLPGQETVRAIQDQVTEPVITGNQTVPPAASVSTVAKVSYDSLEVLNVLTNPVGVQTKKLATIRKKMADYRKTYMEDWKNNNQYEGKKLAAQATAANLTGSSTDPVALEAWRLVYEAKPDGDIAGPFNAENGYIPAIPTAPYGYVQIRDYFNNVLRPVDIAEYKLAVEMTAEKNKRVLWGKFPYTYLRSIGTETPEAQQYTHLDTTK
jgi:hypothetical protein